MALRWQLVAGPASGGHEIALTDAKDRRFTFRLTSPSELSFTTDGRFTQAAAIDELRWDVHVLFTPSAGAETQLLFRGRVGSTGDTLDSSSHRVEATALDYRAVLARRRLYANSTLTYTGQDQALIAWNLIQQTQVRTGGNLGISRGVGQTTGITRDRTYEAGDSIGERIQELSEVIDGFDWDITPASASALSLDVFYPQRGIDRAVVLEYGGLVAAVRREVDPAAYANAIRQTGDDALTAQEREAADLATRPEGRWDAVYGETTIVNQSTLNDRASWQLDQAQVIQPAYTLTLRSGAWEGPDHIWLGDPVRIVIRSGRLNVDTTLRVEEIAVTLGDDGTETVAITLGRPRPDFRKRAAAFEKRLTNLERR